MKKPSAPEFWARQSLAARLLEPLAWAHRAAGAARRAVVRPFRADVPVLCVGNVVAGGAGKTPVVLSLARMLTARGARPHLLSRGYGGSAHGPLAVDPSRHDAAKVGDEALLLARIAPSWISRDRVAGARAAIAAGAGLILMDDGFQNPSLTKDLSLLVIDGAQGFGNGRIIPAGPLREPLAWALARADAVVLMGEDETGVSSHLGGARILAARLVPVNGSECAGRVIAFAGIGRPEKFFRSLEDCGAELVARHGFPDHHPFAETELARLADTAARERARLVTTAKDAARLSPAWRSRVTVLDVEVAWQDEAALAALLAPILRRTEIARG